MKPLAISTPFLLAVLLAACGSSKEIEKSKPSSPSSDLKRYEKDFRPSDYDMDVKIFFSELRREKERKNIPSEPTATQTLVTVQGYRVQLLATSEIDSVNSWRMRAEAEFPTEWFYIVYDAPTYKLRSGNFVEREDADMYAKLLAENGYPDAWIVPERVFKNIQPRIPQPPPTEELPKR